MGPVGSFTAQMNMATAARFTGQTPAPMSVFSRFIGIITSPRDTFASVVAHPKWLVMYLLTAVIMAIFAALPMTTDAGRQAALDQSVSQQEALGFQVSDEAYEQMRKGMSVMPYFTAGGILAGSIVWVLLLSAILWAVFNAALGGDATYKQILAVLVHAGVISALGQLFTGPINYFRGAVTSATSLGSLLPMFDPESFAGRLAGTIDIFIIWWVIVLSIGLAVLYRRKTQPIAIALFGIYACIALAIAAIMS
jgi:hypothetical protein